MKPAVAAPGSVAERAPWVSLRRGPLTVYCVPRLASAPELGRARCVEDLFGGEAAGTGRAPTALLTVGESSERVLLRRLRHGGWLGGLFGELGLGLRRGLREVEVTDRLRRRGAPVPEAALLVGERRAGPLWRAALGTIYEERTRDGLSFLLDWPERRSLLAALDAAARAVRRFHDAGGRHPDLQLKNLLVRESEGGFSCIVIDLDRARAGEPPDPRRRMRELMRLLRSAAKRGVLARVGVAGCARFLSSYCAGDRALRAALLAHLPGEWRRVRRHALLYRGRGASLRVPLRPPRTASS